MFKKDKEKQNKKNWLFLVVVLSFLFKKLYNIKKTKVSKDIEHNFKDFLHKESKEVNKYTHGKEDLTVFLEDSGSIFKDYFIPHTGNNHMPKILHTKSLAVVTLLAILFKFSLVAYLYFVFPNVGGASPEMISRTLELINKERVSLHIEPLTYDLILSKTAEKRANDMIARDYFAHTTPDGKKPWDFVDRGEYAYTIVGENLAMNFSSAESAHNALLSSVSHKQNLLNKKYKDVGLAIVAGELAGKQTRVLVQIFSAKVVKIDNETVAPTQAVVVKETIIETKEPIVDNHQSVMEEERVLGTSNVEPEPAKEVIAAPETPLPIKEIPKQIKEVVEKSALIEFLDVEIVETEVIEMIRVVKHPGDELLSKTVEEQFDYQLMMKAEREQTLPSLETTIEHSDNGGFFISSSIIRITQTALALMLSLIIVALSINIFVRFEIQHKSVLARTVVVVFFIVALLFMNFHYLENGITTIYMS